VLVWILIEGSVMEGEPLRQSLTRQNREGRGERRGEVEHRKEQREWERPSTSSSNETKLSLCLSPCEPYQEGIDPTVGREEKENRESDEMIKRETEGQRERVMR
jgi:hypothetical protein